MNPKFQRYDFDGKAKYRQLYFMVYLLLPFALFWYLLGLAPGASLVLANVGLQLIWYELYKRPGDHSLWKDLLAFVLIPIVLTVLLGYVFGLLTGVAFPLAFVALNFIGGAIYYTTVFSRCAV